MNYKVEFLRLVASVAVVFIHASFYWKQCSLPEYSYIAFLIESLCKFSVPIFVLLSGQLLLSKEYVSINIFYRKRILRIIPGLIFYAIPFLLIRYFSCDESFRVILHDGILFGFPWTHFWYMYMIVVLYFFAPFIGKMVRQMTGYELNMLIISIFILAWASEVYFYFSGKNTVWVFSALKYFGYFILGYRIQNVKNKWISNRILLLVIFILASIFKTFIRYPFIYEYISPVTLIQSLCAYYFIGSLELNENKWVCRVSKYTFGIFLFHPFLFYFVGEYLFANNLTVIWNPLYTIPAMVILGYSLSYLIVKTINKILPVG